MKKVLFIDRDGTLIIEPQPDQQVDSLEKLSFLPHVISNLKKIHEELDFELVMVTNQDGLGTASFPEDTFWPAQNKMLEILASEGIVFSIILIVLSLFILKAGPRSCKGESDSRHGIGKLFRASNMPPGTGMC